MVFLQSAVYNNIENSYKIKLYSNMLQFGPPIVRSSPFYRLKHRIIKKNCLSYCARAVGPTSRYLSAQNTVSRDTPYG
jgi:hypothetical protein